MKALQIFLKKSKVAIFFSALAILSSFLFSVAAKASPIGYDFTIYVEQENCIGCGVCEAIAPECFVVYEDVAWVIVGWEDYTDNYLDALEACPTGAIRVK